MFALIPRRHCRAAQHDNALTAQPADEFAFRIGAIGAVAAKLVVVVLRDQQSLSRLHAPGESSGE